MTFIENITFDGFTGSSNGRMVFGSYCCLTSFLGVISNLLIIFAIGFGKHVGKQVKIQLIHLAVVDLLWSSSYVVHLWADTFDLTLLTTTSGCKFYMFFAYSSLLASPITSAAISIERVFIVYFPFKAVLYRDIHRYAVIGIIWLCASLPQIPFILVTDIQYRNGLPHCTTVNDLSYLYWVDATSLWVPVFLIFISYFLVFVKLCNRKRSDLVRQSSTQKESSTDKVLWMLFVDALVSMFTWSPTTIYELFFISTPAWKLSEGYYVASNALHCIFITNAFSSFIIYFIFNINFRMDLRLLFQRVCCKLTTKTVAITTSSATDQTDL